MGTSGWQYRHWREVFYPRQVRQDHWLAFYAARFQVVEINNTFYRLPDRETFARWAEVTPTDFLFAPKMNRFLTHIKRLKEPREPIDRFIQAAEGLGPKLGPVLFQLPPSLVVDLEQLQDVLQAFPRGSRLAIEPRHASWYSDEVRQVLSEHGAALCLADRDGEPVTPLWRTAPWGYVRFHHGTGAPPSCYEPGELEAWAQRIAERWGPDSDVYVFFNNDAYGCAIRDAGVLAAILARLGLQPSRVAAADEVRLS